LFPVDGSVSSSFGHRSDPFSGERKSHRGVDIAAAAGSPIQAVRAGTVTFAGDRGGYGNVVVVDHGRGLETRYAHCESVDVQVGDAVRAGAPIATVGSTGRSTGPHLHFEVRQDGQAVDPNQVLTWEGKP
jgi:murein DD-endopeptidase MepM/ murein hydrolase activator NlpD